MNQYPSSYMNIQSMQPLLNFDVLNLLQTQSNNPLQNLNLFQTQDLTSLPNLTTQQLTPASNTPLSTFLPTLPNDQISAAFSLTNKRPTPEEQQTLDILTNLSGLKGSAEGLQDRNALLFGAKQKKRRSKHEALERNYVCGCGKNYLSYPALYTHVKTKHQGVYPEGTNTPTFLNGKSRGRGRPRKKEEQSTSLTLNQNGLIQNYLGDLPMPEALRRQLTGVTDFPLPSRLNTLLNAYQMNLQANPNSATNGALNSVGNGASGSTPKKEKIPSPVDNVSSNLFVQLGVAGSCSPLENFETFLNSGTKEEKENYQSILKMVKLNVIAARLEEAEKLLIKEETSEDSGQTKEKTESKISDEDCLKVILNQNKKRFGQLIEIAKQVRANSDRNLKSCDWLFGEYLWTQSHYVIPKFYQSLIMFMKSFRDCLNQFAYDKIKNCTGAEKNKALKFILLSDDDNQQEEPEKEVCNSNDEKSSETKDSILNTLENTKQEESFFSSTFNGEYAPEISNEFIKFFIPKKCANFDLSLAIKLTNHFCNWLYENMYTHSKLTLIK